MAIWTEKTSRISGLKTLMMSFVEVREEGESRLRCQNHTLIIPVEQARRLLLGWKDRAIRSRSLRLLADQSIAIKREELLANAFITWKGRVREHQLEPAARQVEAVVEDGLMFAVWDRWISRSTVSS